MFYELIILISANSNKKAFQLTANYPLAKRYTVYVLVHVYDFWGRGGGVRSQANKLGYFRIDQWHPMKRQTDMTEK